MLVGQESDTMVAVQCAWSFPVVVHVWCAVRGELWAEEQLRCSVAVLGFHAVCPCLIARPVCTTNQRVWLLFSRVKCQGHPQQVLFPMIPPTFATEAFGQTGTGSCMPHTMHECATVFDGACTLVQEEACACRERVVAAIAVSVCVD